MNNKSYTANYFKIYFWKGLSILLNFVSMFVVLPLLSADKVSYGVYAICTSFAVFFSYSDLGFIAAGQKYAAESFARGEKDKEQQFTGFVLFIFAVFVALFALFIVLLAFNPSIFISNLDQSAQVQIASGLFFILAFSSPVYILQRLNQIVYGVRVEDFIPHRTYIFASALKILSVFFFFTNGRRDIVGYFLTIQAISLLAELVNLLLARTRYTYSFRYLLKCFHFNKSIFNTTKAFAANSLFLTVSWVVFYEMDTFMVGKLLGAEQAAVFAIALSLATFFRTILGTFYTPYSVRFFHFVGMGDQASLKNLMLKVMHFSAPLIFIAIATTVVLSPQIVMAWVGPNYKESVSVMQLLVLMNLFAFISYPASMVLMALEKLRALYIIYFLMPVIYWVGVLVFYQSYGVNAFGFFKSLAFYITVAYNFIVLCRLMQISIRKEIFSFLRLLVLPLLVVLLAAWLLRDFSIEPMRKNLFFVTLEAALIGGLAFVSVFVFNKNYYQNLKAIVASLNPGKLLGRK